jgi:hypothetical protein
VPAAEDHWLIHHRQPGALFDRFFVTLDRLPQTLCHFAEVNYLVDGLIEEARELMVVVE